MEPTLNPTAVASEADMQAATRSFVDVSVTSGSQTLFLLGAAHGSTLEAHESKWGASCPAARASRTPGRCQRLEGLLTPQISPQGLLQPRVSQEGSLRAQVGPQG